MRNLQAGKHLESAGTSAMKGMWRACADHYLTAYRVCTPGWDRRYITWSGYTSVLREGSVRVGDQDLLVLRTVAADKSAPALHRVQAHFTHGFVCNLMGDVACSVAGYQAALDVGRAYLDASSSAAGDRGDRVLMASDHGYVQTPMTQVVHELLEFAGCARRPRRPALRGCSIVRRCVHPACRLPPLARSPTGRSNLEHARREAQRRSSPGGEDSADGAGEAVAFAGASQGYAPHSHTVSRGPRSERAAAVGGAADGDAVDDEADDDFDKPIVQTPTAVEYIRSYYEIAMRKREKLARSGAAAPRVAELDAGRGGGISSGSAGGSVAASGAGTRLAEWVRAVVGPRGGVVESEPAHTGSLAFEVPLPHPQESPRTCMVHRCVLLPADHDCLAKLGSCPSWPLGHLKPMGEQFGHVAPIAERVATGLGGVANHSAGPISDGAAISDGADARGATSATATGLDARSFWLDHVARYVPVVVRGGALSSIEAPWDDAFLLQHCTKEHGWPWRALIEKNNRVVQNDRHPLMYDWTFCDFLRRYLRPEYTNSERATPRWSRGQAHLALASVLPAPPRCRHPPFRPLPTNRHSALRRHAALGERSHAAPPSADPRGLALLGAAQVGSRGPPLDVERQHDLLVAL